MNTFGAKRLLRFLIVIIILLPLMLPNVRVSAKDDASFLGSMDDSGAFQAGVTNRNWDYRFGNSGLGGHVYALAKGNGNIYAGGAFNKAYGGMSISDGLTVNHIAQWNGYEWSPLGNGVDNSVYAIAVNGPDIYVGGEFTIAGGVAANHIAKWDGHTWSTLGSGVNGIVRAIAISGDDIFVGGEFTLAGETVANYIAKWDGSSWSALGTGLDMDSYGCRVNAIVLRNNNEVYVGGRFSTAGDQKVNALAKWDGNHWSNVGGSMTSAKDFVNAIEISGESIYVGGAFTQTGSIRAKNIASWDGESWQALDFGVVDSPVNVIAVDESGTLYANLASKIYRLENSSWSQFLDPRVSLYTIDAMVLDRDKGYFAGYNDRTTIYGWEGDRWFKLGSEVNPYVESLVVAENNLYAGGTFTIAGTADASRIARWDGKRWSALGAGVSGDNYSRVSAIAVMNNHIYAGGDFSIAGSVPAMNIAEWDGSSWSALGEGFTQPVRSVVAMGGNIYASSCGSTAGDSPIPYIARWDGNQWLPLGTGVNSCALDMVTNGTDLYVTGEFTTAGGLTVNRVAKWNGTQWSALGGGLQWSVSHAIAVDGNSVYVYGIPADATGQVGDALFRWDGENWMKLEDEQLYNDYTMFGPEVKSILVTDQGIYLGGFFYIPGQNNSSNIVLWNGTGWIPLENGTDYHVFAIAEMNDDIYVGGSFNTAGDKASHNFGRWNAPDDQISTVVINGPRSGEINFTYHFTATISPANVSQPITYTWSATDQDSVVRTSPTTVDTLLYSWDIAGTKFITVTATNVYGSQTSIHQIDISGPVKAYYLHLPIVIK